MENKWKYCFANGSWWVVLDNIDKFVEFKAKLIPQWGNLYERAAVIANQKQISLCAVVPILGLETYGAEWETMSKGNTIWHCGGHYNDGLEKDTTEIVYSDELILPDELNKSFYLEKCYR